MAKNLKHRTVNIRTVFISFVIGAGYWFVDGLIDDLVFRHQPFVKSLFPTEPHELWMRSSITCLLVICYFCIKSLADKFQKSAVINRKSIIINRKTVLTAVGFALLYWFFEGSVHNALFFDEPGFQSLFPKNSHELWMRSFVFCLIIIFSIYIHSAITGLQGSKEEFRAIADYTYDWESWIGADGRTLWINPAVERMTGYTAEECLAMTDYHLALIHKDERKQMAEAFKRASEGTSENDLPFRIVHKDRSIVWAAISWQAFL